jgi:hypothetical protein
LGKKSLQRFFLNLSIFRLQFTIFEKQFDNKCCQPISGNDNDRKTGKEKNFFEKEKAGGYAKPDSQNYIFTYRGEYKKDEKEKTITITGACGAGCGVEEIYRVESSETMKLIKKCEWDY